jgi:hypothetical protein
LNLFWICIIYSKPSLACKNNHCYRKCTNVSGATAGYFYWKFVGCSPESCAITSNPASSTIYGAVIELTILLSIFQKDNKKTV